MSKDPDFVWCPGAGCGSGQVHGGGDAQPVARCAHCGLRFCARHCVAWHEGLSCADYDALLADPERFRGRAEGPRALRQQAADRALAQALVSADEAEAEAARRHHHHHHHQQAAGRRAAESRHEPALRASEAQRADEMRRAAPKRSAGEDESKHRAARESEVRRMEEMRRAALKRKAEEDKSKKFIQSNTKCCPKCKWNIEKRGGW